MNIEDLRLAQKKLDNPMVLQDLGIMLPERVGVLSINHVELDRDTGKVVLHCVFASKITGLREDVVFESYLSNEDSY